MFLVQNQALLFLNNTCSHLSFLNIVPWSAQFQIWRLWDNIQSCAEWLLWLRREKCILLLPCLGDVTNIRNSIAVSQARWLMLQWKCYTVEGYISAHNFVCYLTSKPSPRPYFCRYWCPMSQTGVWVWGATMTATFNIHGDCSLDQKFCEVKCSSVCYREN